MYYIANIPCSPELYHHGIKGQKWGVRRYQNPDGTLTEAGKARLRKYEDKTSAYRMKQKKNSGKIDKLAEKQKGYSRKFIGYDSVQKQNEAVVDKYKNKMERNHTGLRGLLRDKIGMNDFSDARYQNKIDKAEAKIEKVKSQITQNKALMSKTTKEIMDYRIKNEKLEKQIEKIRDKAFKEFDRQNLGYFID